MRCRRNGGQWQRRQLMGAGGAVQIERVHRYEQVGFAARTRHRSVPVVGGALQARGAAARRRVAQRVVVEAAPRIYHKQMKTIKSLIERQQIEKRLALVYCSPTCSCNVT